MNTTINKRLAEIEKEYKLTILYACESGSRGWGFPSPDSDYDARFIYIRRPDNYLSIQTPEGHLSFPVNDELDLYGWDLRKVLQLMLKSNVTPFEWLQSPIVYRQEHGFQNRLWQLAQAYFNPRSNIHHYLGIAKGALDTTSGNELKIKKLFYVLRPLLAAKWCLEKNTIAPMKMAPLMTLLPQGLQQSIAALINLKAGAPEGYMVRLDPDLAEYIHHEYSAISKASAGLPGYQFDPTHLNHFFSNTLYRYEHTGSKRPQPDTA